MLLTDGMNPPYDVVIPSSGGCFMADDKAKYRIPEEFKPFVAFMPLFHC